MRYQQRIFGAGMQKGIEIGQQMERNRITAVVRAAQEQANVRSRQNMIDTAAQITGAVIGQLIETAWEMRKERKRQARTSAA